jgi:predicted amino acid dehydrogenase
MMFLRPQVHGEITGIRLEDGRELRVLLISGTFLPDQIRAHPDLATRLAIQGARLAKEFGAEAFGLGAFLSTVGRKGLDVQAAVQGITITNGGAYTAGTVREAVPGLLERYRLEGGALESATAAVIGANGVVGFGVARMIAPLVNNIILIGKDADRLERSVETLRRKFSATKIVASTDVASIGAADLVFTATSDPDPVVLPEHVKPGAWLYDLGRPADVAPSVREIPGVHIIPGGVVKPPGEMRSSINIHFGDGMVPACMAETMIMTATKAFDRASLGPATKTADIGFYLREGKRLGFEVVTRDERVAELEEAV